ncbi:MAG TPA: hypothetical protein VL947_12095 [Cytophagales bacterium]|nr:hypothetical protein [Cytophagales bacterium]
MRRIRPEEQLLILHLLQHLGLDKSEYPFGEEVDPYEGDVMGSISLGGDPKAYAGDLVQARYTDTDGVPVVITLTQDLEGRLLDLDFWKEDFSKLLTYPKPETLIFNSK